MKKAIIISIQPKWCELIASGKKTIEVRKTKPKIDVPFKCYIYCTQGNRENTFNVPISPEQVKQHYEETKSMDCLNCEVGNGKVIGEFVCDRVYVVENHGGRFRINNDIALTNKIGEASCLDFNEMRDYLGIKDGYGWHISDLKIYDKPKELREFYSAKVCKDYFGGNSGCDDVCGVAENGQCRCGHVALTKPPQSWCYVEELK